MALWATKAVILLRRSPNSGFEPGDFVGCDIYVLEKKKERTFECALCRGYDFFAAIIRISICYRQLCHTLHKFALFADT
jgi:hypothetical protein